MDEVEELRSRLRDDPEFRREVAENPRRSLEPYELRVEDLRTLADDVVSEPGLGPVEQRTRRAVFFQLLVDRRHAEADDTAAETRPAAEAPGA